MKKSTIMEVVCIGKRSTPHSANTQKRTVWNMFGMTIPCRNPLTRRRPLSTSSIMRKSGSPQRKEMGDIPERPDVGSIKKRISACPFTPYLMATDHPADNRRPAQDKPRRSALRFEKQRSSLRKSGNSR